MRSESSTSKARANFESYSSKLTFSIVSDITKPELYENVFSGTEKPITGVINVAAPFTLNVDDNKKDLLDPAVKSAVGILEATKRFGSNVRRVVNTSSFASILDLSKGYRPDYTYSEEDWNPMTFDEAVKADGSTAYCASKALAEKAMWDWMKSESPSFTLAAINPPWVFGPHVGEITNLKHLNESTEALWRLNGAKDVPPIDFGGFADARNVATAHLEAFERPEAGGHRFLVGAHFDYQTAVDILRRDLPELQSRLPEGTPGKLEPVYTVNGAKAEKALGIKYIPLSETLKDSFDQLLNAEKKTAAAK